LEAFDTSGNILGPAVGVDAFLQSVHNADFIAFVDE
jgi:hypothetical protein